VFAWEIVPSSVSIYTSAVFVAGVVRFTFVEILESSDSSVSPDPSAFSFDVVETNPVVVVISGQFSDVIDFMDVVKRKEVHSGSAAVSLGRVPVHLFLDESEALSALGGLAFGKATRVHWAAIFVLPLVCIVFASFFAVASDFFANRLAFSNTAGVYKAVSAVLFVGFVVLAALSTDASDSGAPGWSPCDTAIFDGSVSNSNPAGVSGSFVSTSNMCSVDVASFVALVVDGLATSCSSFVSVELSAHSEAPKLLGIGSEITASEFDNTAVLVSAISHDTEAFLLIAKSYANSSDIASEFSTRVSWAAVLEFGHFLFFVISAALLACDASFWPVALDLLMAVSSAARVHVASFVSATSVPA